MVLTAAEAMSSGSQKVSGIYPRISGVVPQKSCLSVQISLEKMEDLVEYSKVANTISP